MPPQGESATPSPFTAEVSPGRVGRKRDPARDEAILDAAIDVLGEVGYSALTIDAVAARARAGKATVYRRWSSKEELILDAVQRLKDQQVPLDPLPDTGTVRGDLLALFRPQTTEEIERRDRAAAGLVSLLSHHSAFAAAAHAALVDPWADAHRAIMTRAVERGEVSPAVDVETICHVLPTMAAYRALVQREPFDQSFLVSVVDGVLMPALLNDPAQSSD